MIQLLCHYAPTKAAPQLSTLCSSLQQPALQEHPRGSGPSSGSLDTLRVEMCVSVCDNHQRLCLTALRLPVLSTTDGAQCQCWANSILLLSVVLCPSADPWDFFQPHHGLFAMNSEATAPQTALEILKSCSVAFQAKLHPPMQQTK